MTLLVLYGPPAAGKLTVAKLIAEKAGFKLFHNHVSIDVANRFFERGTEGYINITYGIRRLIFEETAKANLNLIFTFVYAYPHDDEDMRWMIEAIEKHGGEVKFVQLVCPQETLLVRISEPSRHTYRKIVSPEVLLSFLNRADLDTPYGGRESLRIDTSTQSPEVTAEQIIQHFKLITLEPK
jgi:predicted kinase